MILSIYDKKIFKLNKEVLEHFNIFTKHGDTSCYFPIFNNKYAIWFNYRGKKKDGKWINPSKSKFINIYKKNDEIIEQHFPAGSQEKRSKDLLRVVFTKDGKNKIYFNGVYRYDKGYYDKSGKFVEVFRRLSNNFNTKEAHIIKDEYFDNSVLQFS